MSRIYAWGSKPTAIANLKADIATFIRTDANGVKSVYRDGLRSYLQSQLQAVIADGEYVSPATATSAQDAYRTINMEPIVAALEASIDPNRWASHPDWPTTTDVLTKDQIVATIKAKTSELKKASAEVTDYYKNIDGWAKTLLRGYYDRNGLDASIPAGVVRNIDTRFYRYTYVNDRGEESAPSPISAMVEVDDNDSVAIGAASAPSGRNISYWRPYRSNVGNNTEQWQYVPHPSDANGHPIGTLTFTDSLKSTQLKEPLVTLTWAEPPADLKGLTEGPNGGMGGFTGNQACFCENYYGYAWPVEYRKTTAWPIVAMGRFDQTYVVLTRGNPYYMTGADSASLDSKMVESDQACVSSRSVVSVPAQDGRPGGMMYASGDGLCLAGPGGVSVITGPGGFNLFDKEAWAALTPSSIVAAYSEGCYIWKCTGGAYSLDMKTGKLTTLDLSATAFYRDLLTDTLYAASGTTIKGLFTAGTRRTAIYKSPRIVLPAYESFAWLQADSEYATSVTVKVYRNGALVQTKVLTGRKPVRCKTGRHNEWEIQVESAEKVTGLTLASSTEELKQV